MSYLITGDAVVETAHKNFSTEQAGFFVASAFRFGLPAMQFKVYYYLAYRTPKELGETQSIDKIADSCDIISPNTARSAMLALIEKSMIRQLPHGKSFLYEMTSPLEWVNPELPSKESKESEDEITDVEANRQSFIDQKLTDQKLTDQKLINKQQQEDSTPPLRGGVESSVAEEDLKPDQKMIGSKNEQEEIPKEFETLNSKIASARKLGWWDAGSWQDRLKQTWVTINRFTVSAQEFMERSLESFAQNSAANSPPQCWREAGERLMRKHGRNREVPSANC